MKVLAVTLLCALAGSAAGGAVAWPGAIQYSAPVAIAAPIPAQTVLKTVIPGQTKTTAYSTTQYINALPAGSYSFGAHPQFAVPLQHSTGFSSLPGYYPFPGTPFVSGSNVFYPGQTGFSSFFTPGLVPIAPTVPGAPAAPINPTPSQPSAPAFQGDQQLGDTDSAVIESADSFSPGAQRQDSPMSGSPQTQAPSQPSPPQFPPANTFPNFPAIPQIPQELSQDPQDASQQPQITQDIPQGPQIPGFPQGSHPQIPQDTSVQPQAPQNTPQGPQMPGFPQIPQGTSPQNPQDSSQQPQFPQIPQFPGFPQIPQGSLPQIPGFPQFPQFPSNLFPQAPQGPPQAPPSNYPGAINNDKGLNDEDTISVESA